MAKYISFSFDSNKIQNKVFSVNFCKLLVDSFVFYDQMTKRF